MKPKRWGCRGDIRTDRTVGGHRRIPLGFLLEFLESTNRRIVDPFAIGLEQRGSHLERLPSKHLDRSGILAGFDLDTATIREAIAKGEPASITVAYVARAVNPGIYLHPAATVEDMYRPERFARTGHGSLEVKVK